MNAPVRRDGAAGLTWFLHFHKAGGSSLVELARRNGETFPPLHDNGNPKDEDGKALRTWDLSAPGLDAYLDDLIGRGVTFAASEWGTPDLDALAARDDVRLVAMLREPVARVVSNFVYDVLSGYTTAKDIRGYVDHHLESHTRSNYYVRMLTARDWREDLPEEMLELATRRLAEVDHVAILEAPDAFERLAEELGWRHTAVHEKRSGQNPVTRARQAARFLLKAGRLDLAARALGPAPRVSEPDRAWLAGRNRLDLALYERAATALAARS